MIKQAITAQNLISETLVGEQLPEGPWKFSEVHMSTETGVTLSGTPSLNRSRRKVLEEGMPWMLYFYFLPRQATAVAIGINGKKKREKRHHHQSYQCLYFHCCRVQDKILGPFHRIWRIRINIYPVFSCCCFFHSPYVKLFYSNIVW